MSCVDLYPCIRPVESEVKEKLQFKWADFLLAVLRTRDESRYIRGNLI